VEQRHEIQKNLSRGCILKSRYTIISRIKKGGMSKIYLARDTNLNSLCVVKELFVHLLFSEDEKNHIVKRFKEEAEYLAKLRHPALPHVTDYFQENSFYYIIMEYVIGDDLEALLKEKGNPGLPENDVLVWSLKVCDVLEYLHSQNPPIVYCDLKPSNLMLRDKNGEIVLVDFGSARVIPHDKSRLTGIGTEGYAPPEQYVGQQDIRSDIYSLGATMHHLLTGKGPYIPFEFHSVRSLVPSLSLKIEQIVTKSLYKDKNKRYQNTGEMKYDLQELYNQYSNVKNQPVSISSFIKSGTEAIKKNFMALMNIIKKASVDGEEKISVMVVDDEPDLRETFVGILSSLSDIQVIETAANGEEAIQKFKDMNVKPHVVVMDVTMPEMDGITATEELIKIDPLAKIVILTALSNQETVLQAFKAGASGYIVKGSKLEYLAEAVREAHRGGSLIGPEIARLLLKEFFPHEVEKNEGKKMKILEPVSKNFSTTNLESGYFGDFLTEMSLSKFTGRLSLSHNKSEGYIYFEKGEIVEASLGNLQNENALYSFPLWNDITVRCETGLKIETPSLKGITSELITKIMSTQEGWNKMKEIIISPDTVFKISLAKTYQVVSISSREIEILAQIKGQTALSDVAHKINKSYFYTAEVIYNLYLMGVVEVVKREKR